MKTFVQNAVKCNAVRDKIRPILSSFKDAMRSYDKSIHYILRGSTLYILNS